MPTFIKYCMEFFLQEIFVGLNDVDGVSGAAAFRSSQPSMQEQILQYQSIGM